ncbi:MULTISPECIES: DMT family transporter [Alphaproteobacteria]|uniref:Multidrug DMT transporter permease n=2 Tax=Alphaproteobacteria TaxID=28211 RepID=A0A512HK79_9HYPH|nr:MULTISPECIES: DMT family transporter [Alphaproteobacteria]GEO85856.1 multidrug DMT transporter permease [Ciceribacter naphthalenivorans]GLR21712.1 multidrug DMT transporter permease [Ciceribacter naphthalenivorans]GLT04568.1 multidrug DMT transporter permease [Sphingomonas psychrolutea]
MSAIAVGLALVAAILHASWNAFLRNGADRLWSVTVMGLAGTAIAVPFIAYFPLPGSAAWFYILLSSGLQVGYSLFLVAAYRHGELGQVYPIVRGTVPLLVTLGGFLFFGQILGVYQTLGVVLVAAGIMSLSLGKTRAANSSLAYALLTGLIIACYSTVDSRGVHMVEQPSAYAMWVLFLYGLMLAATYAVARRGLVIDVRSPVTWKAVGGGVVALMAYGLVVIAYAYAPAGLVTAVRETSVVFAVLIGALFLGERFTLRRFIACLIVAVGAICVSL